MAFKIGDILVQRAILGYGEALDGTPLYTLTNIQSFQAQFSSDSNDFQSGDGSVIKTKYTNRQVEITATNALINFPIIAQMGGSDMEVGTTAKAIKDMPRIFTTTQKEVSVDDIKDAGESDLHVSAMYTNGTVGDSYTVGGTGEGTATFADGKITITPKEGDTKWLISYKRESDNGMKITISGNKFPKIHKLTVRCLVYDVCNPDTPRSAYLVFPRFQSSPDLDLNIQQDGSTLDYTGKANVDFCDNDKTMMIVYMDPDDNEGETI